MSLLARLGQQRVYLDTNIFVYALEQQGLFKPLVSAVFAALDAEALETITSELTLAEALVKPLRDGNMQHQTIYDVAIRDRKGLRVVPISRTVLDRAARLRAASGMQLLDAIHLSTALLSSCTVFLTNDERIRSTELEVLYLRDFAQG